MNRKSINPNHTEDKTKLENMYIDKGIVHVAFSDDKLTGGEELDNYYSECDEKIKGKT